MYSVNSKENVQSSTLQTFLAQISLFEFIKLPSGFQSVTEKVPN